MNSHAQAEVRLKGLPLSEGFAAARVCMFNEQRHSNLPLYRVGGEGVDREKARFEQALKVSRDRLEEIRHQVEERVGKAEAEIFVAHRMILDDPSLHRKVTALIDGERINAESAVASVLDEFETRIRAVDDEYIRERASDFGEIKRRILDVLRNMNPAVQCADEHHCQRGRNRVIVAEELTPSMTVDLDTENVMGFVTERGGVNSHAAILARALGVPAVSGLAGIRDRISCGIELLLNGTTGDVVIWPTDATIREMREAETRVMRMPVAMDPVPGMRVMANINTVADVEEVLQMKAEGIGLYRTEIEVIAAGRFFNEDELYERYSAVRDAMQKLPVIYRLFDIGSDKTLPFMELPREENPALGWRGARLLLGKSEILRPQARALARTAQRGPIHVMYPMSVDPDQFLALKKAFNAAIADLPPVEILHGVMFEVPSACLLARELYEVAEFGSIGTNDLTQYFFAVDRDNDHVAYDYNPDRPVFWDLIGRIAAAAKEKGRSVSVCGEVGGDPRYIGRLKLLGIDTVSVSPRRIPVVRSVVAVS